MGPTTTRDFQDVLAVQVSVDSGASVAL